MNRSFALEEYHIWYSQSEIYLELPLILFSYNTYERAYEPVSGFGFNSLSLKLFMIMIQSLRSVSGISAKEIIIREIIISIYQLLNKPNDKHHIVYEQEIR